MLLVGAASLLEDAEVSVLELVAAALVDDAEVVELELVSAEDVSLEPFCNNLPFPADSSSPLPPPDEPIHNFSFNSAFLAFSCVPNISLSVGIHCE